MASHQGLEPGRPEMEVLGRKRLPEKNCRVQGSRLWGVKEKRELQGEGKPGNLGSCAPPQEHIGRWGRREVSSKEVVVGGANQCGR